MHALDARHLDEAAHGVAGEAEVVFEGDLGSVLHLGGRTAHHLRQPGRRHGTRRAHLALASDFGARDGGVHLEQRPDGTRSQQEVDHAVVARPGDEPHVVVQYRRNDARCPIGGGGHHAPASSVLLVHCHRP